MPVKWTEDGWPYMTRQNEEVPLQLSKTAIVAVKMPLSAISHTPTTSPTVSFPTNGTLFADPTTEYYSLTTNPGHLTIKCADVKSTDKAVLPYIGRRIQHHKYTAGTKLTFVPENDNECAGMLLFKDEVHQYFLGKDSKDSRQRMVLRRITENGTEEIAGKELAEDNKSVDLMIESAGLTLDFKYSLDKGNTWETLASGLDAGFMSTARAGGFTGTTVGLYYPGPPTDRDITELILIHILDQFNIIY